MDFNRHERERERERECHCYSSHQGKVGNEGKAVVLIRENIHSHTSTWPWFRRLKTLIWSLLLTERNDWVSHLCLWPCRLAAPPPPCTPSAPPKGCCPPCGRGRGEARWCRQCCGRPLPSETAGLCHCCCPRCHLKDTEVMKEPTISLTKRFSVLLTGNCKSTSLNDNYQIAS